ncbi:FecR domain-containing protein [Parahaliea maris]|uniref:FecR domain-containing protein n=1 Tax=Parahaliea maris TaxID=2716870 RepID=A0A5C8ZM46_9GAMM|nr:FecR domain-containing protein [Parahaliea maris]TXS89553.1 FecR domain-containing protein [Parahaliea maris]
MGGLAAVVLAVLVIWGPRAVAADAAGMIKTVKGDVTVLRESNELPAQVGMSLYSADSLRTGRDSSVGITLADNTVLSAGPDSLLELEHFQFDPRTREGAIEARLERGSLSAISGSIAKTSPEAVRFSTSTITLGVRGTRFILEAGGSD